VDGLRRIGLPILSLGLLLAVLQAPRLGGVAARMTASLFSPTRGFSDFDMAYYPAAVDIRRDPQALYRGMPYELGGGAAVHSGRAYFVNLPLVAWLFVPFTLLSLKAAGFALLALNVAATLASLALVLNRLERAPPWAPWLVMLVFASSGPLQRALNMGQTTPLILLLLLLVERGLRARADVRAGLLLGLICAIKVPPLIWIPLLLLRGRWRAAVAAVATVSALVVASVLCYGTSLHVEYLARAFGSHAGTYVGAFGNQSLTALLARTLSSADLLEFTPQPASFALEALGWIGTLALAAGLVRAVGSGGSVDHRRLQLELGAALTFALIVLPISWVHYGVWMLPVAIVVGATMADPARPHRAPWGWASVLAAAVLLINFPVLPPWLMGRMQGALWFRVAMSHQAIGQIGLFLLCLSVLRPGPSRWTAKTAQ
jgi:hypothetical protein